MVNGRTPLTQKLHHIPMVREKSTGKPGDISRSVYMDDVGTILGMEERIVDEDGYEVTFYIGTAGGGDWTDTQGNRLETETIDRHKSLDRHRT